MVLFIGVLSVSMIWKSFSYGRIQALGVFGQPLGLKVNLTGCNFETPQHSHILHSHISFHSQVFLKIQKLFSPFYRLGSVRFVSSITYLNEILRSW